MPEQRKYVGARYVPLYMGEWDINSTYEPLSIVYYDGDSYTSRDFVPKNTPIDDETHWAVTGRNIGVPTDEQVQDAVDSWLDDHPEATTTVQDGAITIPKLAQDTLDLIDEKLNPDAYAPMLTAGVADSLLSTDEQTATFTQRVSEGASVGVRAVLGNTVRWNQLFNIQFADGNAATLTKSGNQILITGNYQSPIAYFGVACGQLLASGHKMLVKAAISGYSGLTNPKRIAISTAGATYQLVSGITSITSDGNISCILNITAASTSRLYFNAEYNEAVSIIGESFTVSNIQCFDLTAMFGAGNEPSTVAEFEAMFPEDYYPYDAGSLLSVNVEGIESAGMTREIPVSTYFPNGMRGAGTAYDELQNDKAITRIGAVDLGSLNWGKSGTTDCDRFTLNISDMKYNGQLKSTYPTHAGFDAAVPMIFSNNSQLGFNYAEYGTTTLEQFKAAVSGVYLFYELATPTIVEIDPPINMDYPTEKGGVESIVIPEGEQSAPITLVYVQGYDADGVADRALSVIATLEGAKASTNYAIGAYFVHDGILYRATSAIATGETITPGSNCTATTVMAEIIRLTA